MKMNMLIPFLLFLCFVSCEPTLYSLTSLYGQGTQISILNEKTGFFQNSTNFDSIGTPSLSYYSGNLLYVQTNVYTDINTPMMVKIDLETNKTNSITLQYPLNAFAVSDGVIYGGKKKKKKKLSN